MKRIHWHGIFLFIVCAVMFWWRLGAVGLIDPDEPFYAQTTREMVRANDWITPRIFGQPQFEKPILYYWQSMTAQKLFGDTEFAARMPSALFATLLVGLTWLFGRRFWSANAGFFAALVLATGVEYALMSRLMLTDISLAFFVCASVFSFWLALEDGAKRDRWMFLHFVMSAFAALTKGPIGLLVPAMGGALYLKLSRTSSPGRGRGLWAGIAAMLLIAVPWYACMFAKFGWEYWQRFFVHENWERLVHAEHSHSNHFWYYPMILTVGSLPWIPLLVAAIVRSVREVKTDKRVLYLVCWMLPNLIFFTIVQSKLPTYTFFLFVGFALLMGQTLDEWLRAGFRSEGERVLFAVLAVVQAVAVGGAAGWIGHLVPSDSNAFIKDMLPVIYGVSVMLAVPMLMILTGYLNAWIATTACVSAGIIGFVFVGHATELEEYTSTRGIAAEAARLRRPGEPVVSAPFLARAVTCYLGETPAAVAFLRSEDQRKRGVTQPYFTPHPLNFVLDGTGLATFAGKYPSVLCIMQTRDLERLSVGRQAFTGTCEMLAFIGDRVLFRIRLVARTST